MGLLTDLLLLPITGPVKGLAFIAQQVQDAAEAGLADENQVQAELMTLSMQRDAGEITDEEYDAYETELLELLDAMRIYRESALAEEMDTFDAWDDEP
jgi:outer membrane protein TolC